LMTSGSMVADIKALTMAGVTWAGASAAGLWVMRSKLLSDLRRGKQGNSAPSS